MESHELSKLEALDKAQSYCARSEHCAADVRRKLLEWQVPADFFDSIEQKLRKDDFLNDTRFCHAFVHDKVEYQRWGRLKIQAGLRALQLPESAIREAMDTIDEKRYKENLCDLVALRRTDAPDKRLRFLLQRGFTYDEIINYA